MIEWYRLDFGVAEMQHDVDRLLRVACARASEFPAVAHAHLAGGDRRRLRPRLPTCGRPPSIRSTLAARGIEPSNADGWERDDWLDLVMGALVGPGLGHDAPGLRATTTLRRRHRWRGFAPCPTVHRSRNASSSTWTGSSLRTAFANLATRWNSAGDSSRIARPGGGADRFEYPLDERLLAALAHGLPDCAGVALGFDRLVMAAFRLPSLESAMAFPADRA